jgi:hypothetical protein
MDIQDMLSANQKELYQALLNGYAINPAELADYQYRGISLGLPAWVDRLAWKTFRKVFHGDPELGLLRGWNVRLEQTGIEGPSVPMVRKGSLRSFGHYIVRPLSDYRLPDPLQEGLMLDYGAGLNRRFRPSNCIRDPIVSLEPNNSALLLGRSYLQLGHQLKATRSYFLLVREGSLEDPIKPPRLPVQTLLKGLPQIRAKIS